MVDYTIIRHQTDTKVVINNAAFTTTVNGADMDLSSYDKVGIYVKTGARTSTATMDVKLQVKDPTTGAYTDHTAMTQITAQGDYSKEIAQVAAKTGRIVATFGGSGNFANTYLTVGLKS